MTNFRALRRFNDAGLAAFNDWLVKDDATNPPLYLLDDESLTLHWRDGAVVEVKEFDRKYDLGVHLVRTLGEAWEEAINDAGLMAWLSLAFSKCTMVDRNGKPHLGKASRHVMGLEGSWSSYTHSHRHLVRSAIFFVGLFGEDAKVFLTCPPSEATKIDEQIAGRKTEGLPFSPSIAKALNALYYDPGTSKVKRGASSARAGAIERFVKVVRQLDLTFDVHGLPGAALVELLPKEFDRFAKH